MKNKSFFTKQKPKRDCRNGNMTLFRSEIWKHLLSKAHCGNLYFEHNFKVITKCGSLFQLRVWELVLIKLTKPALYEGT